MSTYKQTLADYLVQVSEKSEIRRGVPLPYGVHQTDDGVNFSFFSRHATHVRLELFDQPTDGTPSRTIDLDSSKNRTGDIWHIWIQGIKTGQLYAYRVNGPYQPKKGHRFNFNKLLLDPYATAITYLPNWDFKLAWGCDKSITQQDDNFSDQDDASQMPKSIVTEEQFDWKDDLPIRQSWSNTIIYEAHVRGLTIAPNSKVKHPGTYRGLIEKIPYFLDLGITAIELMPIFEFNDHHVIGINPKTGKSLNNYWGYDPVSFFAPKASYSSAGGLGQQKLEFKEMICAFHHANIEVILDVVFNHTAEGNELGPTFSFRGIDNTIFYMLEEDKRHYKNYSGTGNTINTNHPVVRGHILNSLRYWVLEMHVDGFRFDLASILGRDTMGNLLPNAPLLERIAEDPLLRDVKIIAEAWDAGGGYEVGSFSEQRWAEWNSHFRDDVRQFWRGDNGMLAAFASRLCGSADIYAKSGKGPECSINFITCHDGFTLNDLVSYRHKHNEINGENNHDGTDANFSDNYGIEGKTKDAKIEAIRIRQIKNFLLTLMVSRGVPMLLGGDEFRRSQQGNNNAYCQDNSLSWYDWHLLEQHQEIYKFTRTMITFRKAHPILTKEQFYTDADIHWFSPTGELPNWHNSNEKQFACMIYENEQNYLYLIFNADETPVHFYLPSVPQNCHWYPVIDTSNTLSDIRPVSDKESHLKNQQSYLVNSRSSVILLTQTSTNTAG